ncbi:MAG: precorrin-8X methylmutase, partial [Coriobacteriales bacterium]|nr:precorrin-8X methylmutase [Coriobacteriales bacterium]
MQKITDPGAIEKASFAIITAELGDRQLDPQNADIIKRVIHTTADFDYADNLVFSDGVVSTALDVLLQGAQIVTDTKMAMSGINKKALDKTGSVLHCFIDAPEVWAKA